MKRTLPFLFSLVLCGCAGGPTKDYYNPAIPNAKFKGAAPIIQVPDVSAETARLTSQGYAVVGRTDYTGKHPEAVELKAQAKRAGANYVVYSSRYVPPPQDEKGSWHFNMWQGGASGGTGSGRGGYNEVHIVFLGK